MDIETYSRDEDLVGYVELRPYIRERAPDKFAIRRGDFSRLPAGVWNLIIYKLNQGNAKLRKYKTLSEYLIPGGLKFHLLGSKNEHFHSKFLVVVVHQPRTFDSHAAQ